MRPFFNSGGLVHYFFPENSLFRAAEWKGGGRLVLSCHQPVASLLQARKNGQLGPFLAGLQAADAVVLMASCELEAYRELAPRAHVMYLPHGVDTAFFSPGNSPSGSDGKFRILTLGNWLRDYSLWAKTVETVGALRPGVEFSILANPGVVAGAMALLTRGHERVRVLTGIPDEQLRDEYRRADLVFLPLLDAWANNALLESMACGRPLLVTDLPATREYAGDAARYIPKGSREAAVAGILELISSPDLREGLGRKARGHMIAGFSWARVAGLHQNLYQELQTGGAARG